MQHERTSYPAFGPNAMTDPTSAPGKALQRIDKWLWYARVVKTRTQAAKLVTDGRVRLNRQRVEKPSSVVRSGDVLTIAVHDRVLVLKIVEPGERRGPASEARTLFEDLSPAREPVERGSSSLAAKPGKRDEGAGRPTKKHRRDTDRLKKSPDLD